jgi:hypothetical protein
MDENEVQKRMIGKWGWICAVQKKSGREYSVVAYGTREDLIKDGIAGEYMFDALGDKKKKSARTEYGDAYTIARSYEDAIMLKIQLRSFPRNPHGMTKVDPYDTDIGEILDRFSLAGGAA